MIGILLSDFHLLWHTPEARTDDTKEVGLWKLEGILRQAKKRKATILQSGDFVDLERSWYLLPRIADLLYTYGVPFYLVRGQHDNYYYNEETNPATIVGALEKAGLVTVLNEEGLEIDDTVVYGSSFGQEVPKVRNKKEFNILVIHAPISVRLPYITAEYTGAKTFLLENPDYNLILCGDIHRRFAVQSEDGRGIVNSGPILRSEANHYNIKHKPGFYTVDTAKTPLSVKLVEVPHSPASEVLTREHLERKEHTTSYMTQFIEATNKIAVTHTNFKKNVWTWLIENKGQANRRVINILSNMIGKRDDND